MFTPTGGSQYQRWWLAHVNIPGVSPGDYNCNGIVDAADYTVWRDHLGQNYSLQNRDPAQAGRLASQITIIGSSHFGQSGSGRGSLAPVAHKSSVRQNRGRRYWRSRPWWVKASLTLRARRSPAARLASYVRRCGRSALVNDTGKASGTRSIYSRSVRGPYRTTGCVGVWMPMAWRTPVAYFSGLAENCCSVASLENM